MYATDDTLYPRDDWHPEDKAWMKARKAQWRSVKYSLGLILRRLGLKRQYIKYHQELFLYGTVNKACLPSSKVDPYVNRPERKWQRAQVMGGENFLYKLPIFWIWYHPCPEHLDLDMLRERYQEYGDLKHIRETYFFDWIDVGAIAAGRNKPSFDPQYGMMGGREALITAFLWPGPDYSQCLTGGRLKARAIFNRAVEGIRTELNRDAVFFPYHPGQYLLDPVGQFLENYPEEIFNSPDGSNIDERLGYTHRQKLLMVLAEVWGAVDSTEPAHRRESTRAMVERLITHYERGGYPDTLQALWSEAKDNGERLREEGAKHQLFLRSQERLDSTFTQEEQEERVARWKLM